jgi:hypothetical protein
MIKRGLFVQKVYASIFEEVSVGPFMVVINSTSMKLFK